MTADRWRPMLSSERLDQNAAEQLPAQPVGDDELATLRERLTLRQVVTLARANGCLVSKAAVRAPKTVIDPPDWLGRPLSEKAQWITTWRYMDITSVRGRGLFDRALRGLKEAHREGQAVVLDRVGALVDGQFMEPDQQAFTDGWNEALVTVENAIKRLRKAPINGDVKREREEA